ncbi:MAG: hypothetical protein ACOCQD_04860 [archaeon]
MTFTKKPIEIQAKRFTEENKDIIYNWAKSIQMNVYPGTDEDGKPILKIPTLEGEMIANIGDYIIVEPFPTDWRKLYPCKPDIFDKTYDIDLNNALHFYLGRIYINLKRIPLDDDSPSKIKNLIINTARIEDGVNIDQELFEVVIDESRNIEFIIKK